MFRSRRPGLVACSALLATLASGCHLAYRDRPVVVLAKDAETGRPLTGADVKITYSHTSAPWGPAEGSARTGQDGIARLNVSPADEFGVTVAVAAAGYLSEEDDLTARAIAAIEPAPFFFGAAKDEKPTLIIPLYAGPRPTVELVVPTGYRGMIRAEVQAQESAPCPPGQRCFRCVVSPSGEARIVGPVLLGRIKAPDFTAKYADGTALPRLVEGPEAVGLWCLASEGDRYTFLVGTKNEYEYQTRLLPGGGEDGGDKPSRSGRGGGGRKGGGRRGAGGTPPS